MVLSHLALRYGRCTNPGHGWHEVRSTLSRLCTAMTTSAVLWVLTVLLSLPFRSAPGRTVPSSSCRTTVRHSNLLQSAASLLQSFLRALWVLKKEGIGRHR